METPPAPAAGLIEMEVVAVVLVWESVLEPVVVWPVAVVVEVSVVAEALCCALDGFVSIVNVSLIET